MEEQTEGRLNQDTVDSLDEIKHQLLDIRDEEDIDKRDSRLKGAWNTITGLVIRLHAMVSKNSNNLNSL